MRQANNSSFYAFLAILIVAGCFIYSWKVLVPNYKTSLTNFDLEVKKAQAAQTKLDSLTAAKTELDGLGNIVNDMFVAIPSGSDAPNLITELEAIANNHKLALPTVSITDSTIADPSSPAASNSVTIAFTFSGKFSDISAAIANLDNDLRFMDIKDVSITTTEDTMSATIQLLAYKRPDLPTAASTLPSVTPN